MSEIYPSSPSTIPAGLTAPNANYKKHAWLAVLGLIVFVTLYVSLSAWFWWTAYRLIAGGFRPGGNVLMGLMTGLPSAFLALFMTKALFFFKRRRETDSIEVTPGGEPVLFDFLYKLADEAGAPRPHKVFISPSVNACVFYDLSILNLLFPSKKNLEIGLGLVNVLNLGELKAVLAHEFGHFAQKSMAVGSWVYIAHQIAGHIIAQRDMLDGFLRAISSFDIRIAWVGWLLRIIVWSIRSLIETCFSLVIISQRALSREMEFHADLVSVSLTGSDALIHALHKLHAADEAWDRMLSFVTSEAADERAVPDIFTIQSRIIERLGVILNDPSYGKIPSLPKENAASHRLFRQHMAAPPKMWATHPDDFAREENAKRNYVRATIDERDAWSVFADAKSLRTKTSLELFDTSKLKKVDISTSLEKLDQLYNKAYLFRHYQGAYLGRSVTRCAEKAADLYGDYKGIKNIDVMLDALYPQSLSGDLERVRNLYEEKIMLEGIRARTLKANGGAIRFRGDEIKMREIPGLIEHVGREILTAEKTVQAHDKRVRTVYLALANKAGCEWEKFLLGLISLLHYAEHTEANLHDIQGYLGNVVAVITADERVTNSELKRLLKAADQAYAVLAEVYEKAGEVRLNGQLTKHLKVDDWKKALGDFELPPPTKENISDWIRAIDGWIASTINALSALGGVTLDQLLKVEHFLGKQHRAKAEFPKAPIPPKAPDHYSTLVEGQERKRQTKLGLWERFYIADGFFPSMVRFAVAFSIVGVVVMAGYLAGGSTVTIYNGLAANVTVNISGHTRHIGPYEKATIKLPPGTSRMVSTTVKRKPVETFEVKTAGGFGDYVYNIAHATPLVEWTQVYGNAAGRPERYLGAPRWFTTGATVLFEDPPEHVRTKSGGASRDVLSALDERNPAILLQQVKDEKELSAMVRYHAIWDDAQSPFIEHWVAAAANLKALDINGVLKQRLDIYPQDMIAMRAQQDYVANESAKEAVCREHRRLARQDSSNVNYQYLAVRCMHDGPEKNSAYLKGANKWPSSPWFSLAGAYTAAEQGDWNTTTRLFKKAMATGRGRRETVAVDLYRLNRMLGTASAKDLNRLAKSSDTLSRYLRLERGTGLPGSPMRFYSLLNKGDLKGAYKALREFKGGNPHALRLLAASEQVSESVLSRYSRLSPDKGIDESSVLVSWSMAARRNESTENFEKIAKQIFTHGSKIINVLNKVRTQGAYNGFEADLTGLTLQERGHTYSAACVLLGPKAPKQWKSRAMSLLFANERPYFKV